MVNLKLISDWSPQGVKRLGAGEYATLTKEDGNAYYSFDGVKLTNEDLNDVGFSVKIGIYQVNNVVYAFAASNGAEFEPTQIIQVEEQEEQTATLIASGMGTLDKSTKTVNDIDITLNGAEGNAQFKQLGFSGEIIKSITDSAKADTIYVIGNGESKSHPNAALEFINGAVGGEDKVIFVGSTTIQSINSGGYTHLSVRGHPRAGSAEGFQCKSYVFYR